MSKLDCSHVAEIYTQPVETWGLIVVVVVVCCCYCLFLLLLFGDFFYLQRVSCWSLLGRKTSSEQPLAPYLHGSPIIPTIFSNAWFGASTNVCLQILQLFNPCDFLIGKDQLGDS